MFAPTYAHFRKLALAAAVLLTIRIIQAVFLAARGLIAEPFGWDTWVLLVTGFLLLLPSPVLCWALYGSEATFELSPRMRVMLLILAVIIDAEFTTSGLFSLIDYLSSRWAPIQWFDSETVAAKLWRSLAAQNVFVLVNALLGLSCQGAFGLLLLTVYRLPEAAEHRQSRLLRETAAIASIVMALATVFSLFKIGHATLFVFQPDFFQPAPTRLGYFIRLTLGQVSPICWMLAAYVFYRSQTPIPAPAMVEAGPAEVTPPESPA